MTKILCWEGVREGERRGCLGLWWRKGSLEEVEEEEKREKERVREKERRETRKEKGKREKEGEERRKGRRE